MLGVMGNSNDHHSAAAATSLRSAADESLYKIEQRGSLWKAREIAVSRLRVRVQYESQAEGSSPLGRSRLGLTLDSATIRTSSSLDDGYSLASARFRSRWLSLGATVGLRCFQSSTVPSPRIRSSPMITLETATTPHPALPAYGPRQGRL
jgi:hypothetical protein